MAKTRGRARKAAGGRKRAAASRRSATSMRRGQRVVRLKPVHDQVQSTLRTLKREKQTPEVRRAIGRLNRVLMEIKGACGPTMIVPLATE